MSDVESPAEHRLYAPDAAAYFPKFNQSGEKLYCYAKNPGEDYYHLILRGELHLANQDEAYCLSCAVRLGILTNDRRFWQRSSL